MDPNQTQPPTVNPTPPPPPAPSVVPPVTPPPTGGFKIDGKVMLFTAVGVILLIVLGVTYFMATQLNNKYNTDKMTPVPTQILTPTPTPSPTPLSEKDIDTIDLGTPGAELESIEEDVKQL